MIRSFLDEFKEFINKGNLIAIAVGFVMGAAFTAMITGLVDNVIMPIVAIPFGKPSFDEALILTINHSQIRFGAFLTTAVSFLAIAATVFFLLKAYNKLTRGEATAPAGDLALMRQMVDELRGLRSDLTTRPDAQA